MHPLLTTNLSELSDQALQEKIGELMQKMTYCGRYNNMQLYNQLRMVYQMYLNESYERATRKSEELDVIMREKKGLPKEDPPSKNLTLD